MTLIRRRPLSKAAHVDACSRIVWVFALFDSRIIRSRSHSESWSFGMRESVNGWETLEDALEHAFSNVRLQEMLRRPVSELPSGGESRVRP